MGDFLKSEAEFLPFTNKATELIGWLQGKTYVLALLQEVQLTNSQHVLAVICAVLTRWTAHYLAYHCLLEIWISLQLLIENDEKLELRNQQLLLGDASAQEQSWKNIAVIKNSAFWHTLARYVFGKYGRVLPNSLLLWFAYRIKKFLELLAIASNITQADSARVDIILITFAFLYIRYSKFLDTEDIKARDAILASIERRWLKIDQDVFIAGVLLNPFHKAKPFCAAPFSTLAGLYNLLHCLWNRFYHEDPPAELYMEYKAYINGTGELQAMHNFMQGMQLSAEKEVCEQITLWYAHLITLLYYTERISIHLRSGMQYPIWTTHRHHLPDWHIVSFQFVPILFPLNIFGVSLVWFSWNYEPVLAILHFWTLQNLNYIYGRNMCKQELSKRGSSNHLAPPSPKIHMAKQCRLLVILLPTPP